MKGQTFQSFWTGGPLTLYEWMCIKSFIDHGHGFELYTYTHDLAVPEGCILKDAAELMPESAVFTARGGSYAIFADIFRYKLLTERGGWWVDTDIVCLSDDWPDAPRQIGYEPKRPNEPEDFVNNAVLRAEPGDKMMAQAYAAAQGAHADTEWGTTGPRLWTQLLADEPSHGYTIQPIDLFYSVSYDPYDHFHFPNLITLEKLRAKGAVGLHLWNDKFGQFGISKKVAPPARSILWQCFAETGTLGLFTEQYLFNARTRSMVGPFENSLITETDTDNMLKISAEVMAKGVSYE